MKKKQILAGLVLAVSLLSFPVAAFATGETGKGLKSKGNFYFENKTSITSDDISFYSQDLYHLANRIDVLIEVCR